MISCGIAAELVTLGLQQVDLVLELLPDCSNLMLFLVLVCWDRKAGFDS